MNHVRGLYTLLLFFTPTLATTGSFYKGDMPRLLFWRPIAFSSILLVTLLLLLVIAFFFYPKPEKPIAYKSILFLTVLQFLLVALALLDVVRSDDAFTRASLVLPFLLLLAVIKTPTQEDFYRSLNWILLSSGLLLASAGIVIYSGGLRELPSVMNALDFGLIGVLLLAFTPLMGSRQKSIVSAILGLSMVILSGSRNLMATAMLVCLLLILETFSNRRGERQVKWIRAIGMVSLLILASFTVIETSSLINKQNLASTVTSPQTENSLETTGRSIQDATNAILNGRISIWTFYIGKIIENPTNLFGIPSSQIRNELGIDLDTPSKVAPSGAGGHNMVLNHWVKYGFISVLALTAAFILSFRVVWNQSRNFGQSSSFIFLVAFIFSSVFDTLLNWTEISGAILFWNFAVFFALRTSVSRRVSGPAQRNGLSPFGSTTAEES
jgi:O-antigen ligase